MWRTDSGSSLLRQFGVLFSLFLIGCGQGPEGSLQQLSSEPESRESCGKELGFLGLAADQCYEVINGKVFFMGDIYVGELEELKQRAAEGKELGAAFGIAYSNDDTSKLWPNGIVPYELSSYLAGRSDVQDAIDYLNSLTPETHIKLVPRTSETAYVYVYEDSSLSFNGYSSHIGRSGSRQTIVMNPTTSGIIANGMTGTLVHEFGHVFGLWHEQNREDRDEYIIINWSNIPSGKRSQYEIKNTVTFDDIGPYDFLSNMHYKAIGPGIDPDEPVFTKLDGSTDGFSSPRYTTRDIRVLKYLYRTPSNASLPFADNFNRTDDFILGGAWDNKFGKVDVSGGKALGRAKTGESIEVVNGTSATDLTVSGTIQVPSTRDSAAYVLARFSGSSRASYSYYGGGIYRTPDGLLEIRIVKSKNGTYSKIAQKLVSFSGGEFDLKLAGNTISLYVNDSLHLQVTDNDSPVTSAGKVGIRYWQRGATVDNFYATSGSTTDPEPTPDPGEFIIDNTDAYKQNVGTWWPSSGTPYYGTGSLYNDAGGKFQWHVAGRTSGTKDVYVWWTHAERRSNSVPYKVYHANGVNTFYVDQTNSSLAGKWNYLGRFEVNGSSYVEVASTGSGVVANADAVKLVATSESLPDDSSEIVVDNKSTSTSKTGTWYTSTGPGAWGSDSVYSDSGSTFRWTPGISTAGVYKVYAHWTYHANRSNNVPYTITHRDGTSMVNVNQADSSLASKWVLIGTHNFDSGTGGYVQVSSANGQANADAVKLVYSPTATPDPVTSPDPEPSPSEIIIDNTSSGTSKTGTWYVSEASNPYGLNSLYSDSGSTFRWTPSIPAAGGFKVYARWTYHANRGTEVPYTITHQSGSSTVYVNQRDPAKASTWILLGTYNFGAGTGGHVQVSSSNGQANADAVKFVPTTSTSSGTVITLDNTSSGTSKSGSWYVSQAANPYGSNSLYSDSGSAFRWTPNLPESGTYNVYAYWTYHENRSTNVPYMVGHLDGISTIYVNQRDFSKASNWILLGTYSFSSGTAGYVRVTTDNGQACADAVRFEKVE